MANDSPKRLRADAYKKALLLQKGQWRYPVHFEVAVPQHGPLAHHVDQLEHHVVAPYVHRHTHWPAATSHLNKQAHLAIWYNTKIK